MTLPTDRPIRIWVAVSSRGYPAPVVGWAYSRKDLDNFYQLTHNGNTLASDGYIGVKAQLVIVPKAAPR